MPNKWYGTRVKQEVGLLIGHRVRSATAALRDAIKEQLSTPGPEPSAPGEYPHYQGIGLNDVVFRESVKSYYDAATKTGRVGTMDPRGKWFELGTSKMAPRPWLSNAWRDFGPMVTMILETNQPTLDVAADDSALEE